MAGKCIDKKHPLRKLFEKALDFAFAVNAIQRSEVREYIEEQILCEFIHVENLYKIRDAQGKRLEDIADLLAEGDVLLNAQSFSREFQVHKHIGDYTLFMLGMFPAALLRRKGKEFLMGQIIVPGANLFEHYTLQGKRSYRIASQFTWKELFTELSTNFLLYMRALEMVRVYFESMKNREFLRVKEIVTGSGETME